MENGGKSREQDNVCRGHLFLLDWEVMLELERNRQILNIFLE